MFGGIVNAIKGFFDLVTTLVEFVFGFLQSIILTQKKIPLRKKHLSLAKTDII